MNYMKLCRELPVTGEYDVIVAGAGPAGIAAAVSSARLGARTALIERLGILGGNMTAGHVGPLMGGVSKGTMAEEVHGLLETRFGGPMHDIEKSKTALLHWVKEAGVELYLQTPLVDVISKDGHVDGLVISTKAGLEVLKGKTVVDATGDGMAAYLAGAEVMMGRDGDGLLQPVTLMYTVAGVDTDHALFCGGERSEVRYQGEKYVDFCIRMHDEGKLPQNVSIVRLYPSVNKGEVMVNATQENYINGLDHADVVKAELRLRKQVEAVTGFLRSYVPGYEKCYVKDSADVLGVRETRRIKGEYVLQDEDLLAGRTFGDVMVHRTDFVIDIHNPSGGGQAEGLAQRVKPYDIPYRCLVPLGIDNLLTAGRCISGTHRAHASYRVMNICMAMGQAAGIAAALATQTGTAPGKLDYRLVQKEMSGLGIDLFGNG